jgi:hypothetical protein
MCCTSQARGGRSALFSSIERSAAVGILSCLRVFLIHVSVDSPNLLPSNPHFVDHLEHVWNSRGDRFCPSALRSGIDLASQCDDAILDSVMYPFVESILDQRSVKAARYTLVHLTLGARPNHANVV